MQNALHKGKTISLDTLGRSQFQMIYEAGIRNELTCAHCKETVHLAIGIHQAPYFYHRNAPHERPECMKPFIQKQPVPVLASSTSYEEQGGFRIPKSRAIGKSEVKNELQWKNSTFFTPIPAFSASKAEVKEAKSSYSHALQEHQIVLDTNQWSSVTHFEGPLLILAGAGSGKTRVLTARTAYMIQEHKIDPRSIMLVTFTSKAAKEMKSRLTSYPGMSPSIIKQMLVGTFHSIFLRMVVHHAPDSWQMNRLLKWDWQKEQILKEAGREINLDEKDFPFDQAIQQISYWKNTLLGVKDIRPASQWEEQVHHLYTHYEQTKQKQGLFDFDDMLDGCYQMLRDNPEILVRYQKRFRYFLIDEFQDINKVQYAIMKMLSADSKNLCVVGDDDQSIYAFRGSDPSFILNFERDFPGTKKVTLHQNYRSAHSIVSAANKVVERNTERHPKNMKAQFHHDHIPTFFFPYDEEEEATMIVRDIKEKVQAGASPSDFCILYRTHASSRAVFERLSQSNLPFTIEQDADSFYERRIVKTMLAFLRLSLDPNDNQSLTSIVQALFLKKNVLNDLKAMSILNDVSFVEALGHLKDLKSFQQKKLKKIIPLFSSLKKMKPVNAIETISKDMGFDDFVKKRGNEGNAMEKGSDDVRDLRVVARKFSTVKELLDHADHMIGMNKEMKVLSKQFNESVHLTTIHRAKGLEYKHVYVLGNVDGGIPHDYALESYRNGEVGALEEERRLLYVAMTRAKLSLYLSVLQTRRGKTAYPSRFLKPFLKAY